MTAHSSPSPHVPKRTNPLRAWRLTQRRWDAAKRAKVALSVAQAAREYEVSYQTWYAWECDEDDTLFRRPDADNLRKLFVFTGGQVRPDHFFNLPTLRGQIAEQREASAAGTAALPDVLWCDQCDKRRTRAQVDACASEHCDKRKAMANALAAALARPGG